MANLKNSAMMRGRVHQAASRDEVCRDRFFHQDIDAVFKQRTADLGMRGGRDGDHHGVYLPREVCQRTEDLASVFRGSGGSTATVDIHDAGKLRIRCLAQNAEVMPAEGAGADDGCTSF